MYIIINKLLIKRKRKKVTESLRRVVFQMEERKVQYKGIVTLITTKKPKKPNSRPKKSSNFPIQGNYKPPWGFGKS